MSHIINAVIAREDAAADIANAALQPPVTALPGGWWLVPLSETQIDALTKCSLGQVPQGFSYLGSGLEAAIARALRGRPAAYLETEYFGGLGSQAAALFNDGGIEWRRAFDGLITRDSPINAALRALGVRADGDLDEFDTLELWRYREFADLGLRSDDEE